ncbi:MAG TPA: DUF4097 family beta strand repeat-containing protein [Vicinamibacterales bacterium]|nr:DUF4097 family beta strand repeat-containing protein [Vicinamibacterales bacterium]
MMTPIATLAFAAVFTASALAQTPAAPVAPVASASAPDGATADRPELDVALAQAFELQTKDFERAMSAAGAKMAELFKQFPVPPVPPVPPRDPRAQQREVERAKRTRRRFPEGWVESTEPFSRTFKVGKGSALIVSNISGNIRIAPATGDQIDVQALKHAWGPNAERAKERLGDAVVEAHATGNRVELRVERNVRKNLLGVGGGGIDVEFDVKVPDDASVELRTVSGDMRVTNVKGEIRVQGVSGNVALEGTPRLVMVKSVSGNISLTNAGADAQLSISTVNGDLLVQTLSTHSLDLNTVNGDVRIGNWSGDRAHIRTLSGDLDLQTSLTTGGRYEIESHSGDVVISLPEQPGFELETNTFSGRVRVDFPIKSEGPVRENNHGPRSVRGTYGDGSSVLRVQTFSGDLTITRR